jgi:hypothetical protein
MEGIADDLGTAVNIQAMVFGNARRRQRDRRRLHPRPGHRRAGALRRLPRERAGRGRRRRHARRRSRSPSSGTTSPRWRSSCAQHLERSSALPRHVRCRVHHRARQAVHPADPRRQAHRRWPRSAWPSRWSDEGLIDAGAVAVPRRARHLERLLHPRFAAGGTDPVAPASRPRREPRRPARSSPPMTRRSGPRGRRRRHPRPPETSPEDLEGMIAARRDPDQPGWAGQPRRRRRPWHRQAGRLRRVRARDRRQGRRPARSGAHHPSAGDRSRSTARPGRWSSATVRW